MRAQVATAVFTVLTVLIVGCGSSPAASATPPPATATSTPTAAASPSAAAAAVSPATAGAMTTVTEVNAAGMGGAFSPASISIRAGDSVEWVNKSGNIHNVTFPDMHSPVMFAGDKWTATFSKPGTYKYTCTYHPGMDGVVVVS